MYNLICLIRSQPQGTARGSSRGVENPTTRISANANAEWENESFWSKPIVRWKYGTGLLENLGRVRSCCAYNSQASAALTSISGVES